MKLEQLLKWGYLQLNQYCTNSQIEAQILLCHVLKISRVQLFTQTIRINSLHITSFQSLIARRLNQEPIAYLIGEQEFWSYSLIVTPDTLIPRPETEKLVEVILQEFSNNQALTVIDLGTGSGAIAIALATMRPNWKIHAIDFFPATLEIAKKNALNLNLPSIHFKLSYWLREFLPAKNFDLIISNPPYIRSDDHHLYALRYEPKHALIAGKDGLDAFREIICSSEKYLRKGGKLFLEHGYDQGLILHKLLVNNHYQDIVHYNDFNDIPRIISARSG